jgi:hypothetical protein
VHDSENKNSRVLVHIDPDLKRVREKIIEFDFSWIELQGRSVKGSTLTAHKVDRVVNAPKADGDEDEKNAIDANSKTISEKENLRKPVDKQTEVIKDAKAEKKDSKLISESRKPTKDQGTFDFQDN